MASQRPANYKPLSTASFADFEEATTGFGWAPPSPGFKKAPSLDGLSPLAEHHAAPREETQLLQADVERLSDENEELRGEIEILRRQLSGAAPPPPDRWSEAEQRAAASLSAGDRFLSSAQFIHLRAINRRGLLGDPASQAIWRLARKTLRKRRLEGTELPTRLKPGLLKTMAAGLAIEPKRIVVFRFMEALVRYVEREQQSAALGGRVFGTIDDKRGAKRIAVAWVDQGEGRKMLSLRQWAKPEDDAYWPPAPTGHVALNTSEMGEFLLLLMESIEKLQGGEAASYQGKATSARVSWGDDGKGEVYLEARQHAEGSAWEDWLNAKPGEVRVGVDELERFVDLILAAVEHHEATGGQSPWS